MKTLKFLAFFTSIFLIILATGCEKDEETLGNTPTNESIAAYEAKTIEIPNVMANSSEAGAQETEIYMNMFNNMAMYGSMLTPPSKNAPIIQFKDSGTETHTWVVNEGSSNYTVTLNVSETSTMISWECILNGTMSGISFNNFIYIEAEEYKDGSSSRFTLYDWETFDINMELRTQKKENEAIEYTLEMPARMIITLIINTDGSGNLQLKDWEDIQYILTFESSWDASGHGEYWVYQDGDIVDQGSW